MLPLTLIVLTTIFISAQCSLYEATLYSTRLGTLEAARQDSRRSRSARFMSGLKEDIAAPIAAILILNTVANTAGATFAGMYADRILGHDAVPVFSLFFTLAILLFAEIIPKTYGAIYWRSLWPLVVWPMLVMKTVLSPFVVLVQWLSALLTRGKEGGQITEEDILGAVRLGARQGEITPRESRMVHSIIRLEDRRVKDIMTPGAVVLSVSETLTASKALEHVAGKGLTRIPVYREREENVTGYVLIHDLIDPKIRQRPETRLSEMAKPISVVLEDNDCLGVLTRFLRGRIHIAMVQNAAGSVTGLVSLEDLIETAIGSEIVDETDTVVDMQALARTKGRTLGTK